MSLSFAASILSGDDHGKYEFAPDKLTIVFLFVFTENGTIKCSFTTISFLLGMLPKFITNFRVIPVGLSVRGRDGDGTSAL